MNASERKLIELTQKVSSLNKEFKDWQQKSEAGQFLEKHYTQIRRITAQMEGFCAALKAGLKPLDANPERVFAVADEIESNVVEVCRIWDFFRSKLLQRCLNYYQAFLYPADEFAWSCYEPAQRRVLANGVPVEKVKEPPLVYFHFGVDLLATRRNSSYTAGLLKGGLTKEKLIALLKPLPIPLIGIPWFQMQHLPDVLVIAHEVGHHVEDDFLRLPEGGSRPRQLVEDATRGLPDERRRKWRLWQGEVFADVYGTLATGPAFVGALRDFLSGENRSSAPAGSGTHPPPPLRVRLALEVLRRGFPVDDECAKAALGSPLESFESDIPLVVNALLNGPYPELGKEGETPPSLPEILNFGPIRHKQALADSKSLLAKLPPAEDDPRSLFASARLAYEESPRSYVEQGVQDAVLDRIPRRVGVRAEERRKSRETLDQIEAFDLAAGQEIFATIAKLRTRN